MKIKQSVPIKRKRGRPVSRGKGSSLSVYLPKELADTLLKISARKGKTIGELIRIAIGLLILTEK
jgi:hypothetical protein